MNAPVADTQPPRALHNMSAPPRTTVELRPLRADSGSPGRLHDGDGARASCCPSARLYARVHLPGLITDGRSHVPRGTDIARGLLPGTPDLADAVAILRTARAKGKVFDAESAACATLPFAALQEEFLARVAAIGDASLPAVLLARPLNMGIRPPRAVTPAVAIRLLAGTAGGLFLRARAPSAEHFLCGLPGAAVPWEAAFDYYELARHGQD